ncbi:MAG: phosphatase PAP2 family protein [Sphingobacteriaceae bacterium]|nr:phosphatase PAP2 family protein [Sphingobacteriaceae bacterium]
MSPYRKRLLCYVLGIITLGFIALTILIVTFPESVIDKEFSEEIQEHQHPILDNLMKIVSSVGIFPYSFILVIVSALIFFLFKLRKEALYICLTGISGVVSSGLKILINRPRPTEDVVRIIEQTKRQSFPSGHVLFYVVFFGFLALLMHHLKTIPRSIRITVGGISLFQIFMVPISRVYLGAHWFTDVLGGFLLGMLCLLILSYMYLRKPAS